MALPFQQSGGGSGGTTLTGTGIARNTGACTELSGDATTSGSNAVTLKSVGSAGTYTKVTTDAQGRVSSGTAIAAADLPALTTAGQGYFLGLYGFWYPVGTAAAVTNASGNQIHCFNMMIPYGIEVRKVTMRTGSTASSGGKFACAIYDATGTVLLIDSTNFLNTVANAVLTNTLSSPVILPPGNYWFVWAQDNTTGTLTGLAEDNTWEAMFVNDGVHRMGNAANAWSNSTGFPPALGAITSAAMADVPMVFFTT